MRAAVEHPGQPIEGMPDLLSGFLALLETYDSRLDMDGMPARYGVVPTSLPGRVRNFVRESQGR